MQLVAQLFGIMLCVFLGLLGATIIIWIWQGKIDLSSLLSEAGGQASMSRFQLLLFSFVIAISLFEMVALRVNSAGFPEIPAGVLTLLGISASTYAVGKGISYSQPQTLTPTSPSGDGDDDTNMVAAVAAAKAAADQAAAHAATAQQAVQQAAAHAAKAQKASGHVSGNPAS